MSKGKAAADRGSKGKSAAAGGAAASRKRKNSSPTHAASKRRAPVLRGGDVPDGDNISPILDTEQHGFKVRLYPF